METPISGSWVSKHHISVGIHRISWNQKGTEELDTGIDRNKKRKKTSHKLLVGGLVAINYIFPLVLGISNHPNWLSYFLEGFKPPTRFVGNWILIWSDMRFPFWWDDQERERDRAFVSIETQTARLLLIAANKHSGHPCNCGLTVLLLWWTSNNVQ